MAIASAAHTGFKVVVCKELSPVGTGILNALVGMDQNFVARFSPPQGHQQGVDDQIGARIIFHAPANDLPGEQVQDNRQIQPAFVGADICEIRDPRLVLALNLELTIQRVWSDVTDATAFKTSVALIAPRRADFRITHDPVDTVFATVFTVIFEVFCDVAIAIGTAAFKPELFDQAKKPLVFKGSWATRAFKPGIKATAVNAENTAHNEHPVFIEPGFYERVLLRDSLAKNAAASFNMSRSSVTRRSSDFNRRSSSC